MARDPRWGRTPETYGEDPYLSGVLGTQFVKGLQGDDLHYLKVVATAQTLCGEQ
jgi:beta-glucosidase